MLKTNEFTADASKPEKGGYEQFNAFLSLNRFFALAETNVPTPEQIDQALELIQTVFGKPSEAELLNGGNSELIELYNSIKAKILTFSTSNNSSSKPEEA